MSPVERHPVAGGQLHPLRATDLTCSELGAAAGVDPYRTQLALYAEKTGQLRPAIDNLMMRRGRWLEPAVIAAIREIHPDWEVRKCNVYLRDPEIRLGGTPDAVALTGEDNLINLQLKVISKPVFERWDGQPPTGYMLQTLGEGMLMDVVASKIVCLVIDTYSAELFEFPVSRHPAAEDRVRALAVEFWDNVEHHRVPRVDLARDADTIAQLYPAPVPEKVIDLSTDNLLPDLLHERAGLKQGITVAEKRVGEIDTDIKAKLGDAEKAVVPGWRISWGLINRKETVQKATSFRQLRVTADKEEAA